eukprot:scaffold192120_cov80-Attheya_sp.AAC.1
MTKEASSPILSLVRVSIISLIAYVIDLVWHLFRIKKDMMAILSEEEVLVIVPLLYESSGVHHHHLAATGPQ